MKNVSLKLPLLIFILVITANLGAEARKLTGLDEKFEDITGSSSYAGTGRIMTETPAPPCKNDFDCIFRCPKDGVCNPGPGPGPVGNVGPGRCVCN
ncbi:unnamed protein product [Microthlaspi erraticum]|uniref:Uncharacterized protein n=1 Tax=Microthlaspi erraticum TaxID=1685480 RepID=A0A6D2JXW6_9BRAS|nr:unnamed protein product [Microthlaspi erraticum]